MADMTFSGPFPTMGDEGIPSSIVNISGERSPYTKVAPKGGAPTGPDVTSTNGHAGSTVIRDAQGPTQRPVTTICYPNAPEASTPRGVRVMPSAIGNRDFWAARAAAGA